MHKEIGIRFDRIEQPDGGIAAAWGFRSGDDSSITREYLALAYTIPADGFRVRPDMTHEFNIYMLNPKVAIDFGKSLFNQPRLVPIKPSVHGFQMSVHNENWVELHGHAVIELIRKFEDEIDVTLIDRFVLKTAVSMVSMKPDRPLVAAE